MGYSGARSALYGHRLADVFILYHKRTFASTEKWLNKGIFKGFEGIREGQGDTGTLQASKPTGSRLLPHIYS